MPAFITVGRVLFSVLFIVSGASKLFDIAATAEGIASKVVIPAVLTSYTAQLEGLTGLPTAQMLAIAVGALEVICGLFIALNFGARIFSLVLVVFIVVATFYYHDFWNQTGAESQEQHDPRVEEPVADRGVVHYRRNRPSPANSRAGL